MRAAVFHAPGDIRLEERPDPVLLEPTDAIVRVVLSCVCGSDLWYYRGQTPRAEGSPIGHEFVGVVEEVGPAARSLRPGELVIAPFAFSDGTCPHCVHGATSVCTNGGFWGAQRTDGGQGERVRVPFAAATLMPVPDVTPTDPILPALLALSDVLPTGHHAAVCAGVAPGDTVAVIGDGAVGLSGILAARRLGAARIIALSRNPARQELARRAGADEIVPARGGEAIAAVLELTDGVGADATLECVGTAESMSTALGVARPLSRVGFVGVPHGASVPLPEMFARNVGLWGGVAPARAYLPELLPDVLAGRLRPELVFDATFALERVAEAYAAMDERRVTKALLTV